MRFINRERELGILERSFDAPEPSLFVLYGRRRVGKSALLRRACEGRRRVFFTADIGSRRDQLESFSACLAEGLSEPEWASATLGNWEDALRLCVHRARAEPLVLVLDEFQHLITADPPLASVLQRLWDGEIQASRLSVVLCGSYVSFMEREVLGVRNPLYGRRTGQLLLKPLRFRDAARFFPDWPADEAMTALGIVGGVPAYLRQLDPEIDVPANVSRSILGLGAPLFDEPRFLMMEELREPQSYFSICRAVAHGHGRPNEIAQAAGLEGRGNITSYLASLRELHLLERRVPATVRNPERSRRGLYRLGDPFLRFWFRFVLPNRTALEAGDAEIVWRRKVEPHLSQHVATAFEDACREHLQELNRRDALPAAYDRFAPWWRGPQEVDLVAVADDGALLLGECKWSTRAVGTDVLESLREKAPLVVRDLKRAPDDVRFALFSRSGFTPALEQEARDTGVLLFSVEDVLS